MIIFVSYDATIGYPQPAQFGKGVARSNGTHKPDSGLNSFPVDTSSLSQGADDRFYVVSAPDTLAIKSQPEVDLILFEDNKKKNDEIAIRAQRKARKASAIGSKNNNRSVPQINTVLDQILDFIEGIE